MEKKIPWTIQEYVDYMYLEGGQDREFAEKIVGEFLLKNGFKKKEQFLYDSDKAQVMIKEDGYMVSNKISAVFKQSGRFDMTGHLFSDGFNIYWLIGVLTYNGLMDKNYKQL